MNRSLTQDISSFATEFIATPTETDAPVWSIDFTRQSPASAGLSFSRASNAGCYDNLGNWVTALTDTLRRNHHPLTGQPLGYLAEEARTNFLLNSTTPATQTVALTNGTHVLWVEGAGSCTCSPGSANGSGFGTATHGSPVTFSLSTSGTVTFTVSGSLTRFQCEKGLTASSFIATTGASATRAADICSLANAPINPSEGSLLVVGTITALTSTVNTVVSLDNGNPTTTTRLHAYLRTSPSGIFTQINGSTVADLRQNEAIPAESLVKLAFSYGPSGSHMVLNGALKARTSTPSQGLDCTMLRIGHKIFSGGAGQPNSHIARVAYYNRALSTAQLQQLTA